MNQTNPQRPSSPKQFWAIVPAAGVGTRMQADRPKQYLELLGKTLIEHSVQRLLDVPEMTGVVIALDKQDTVWSQLHFTHTKPVLTVSGGEERCHSVLNALQRLETELSSPSSLTGDDYKDVGGRATSEAVAEGWGEGEDIWVLVHDAARPCVRAEDLGRLIELASLDDHGGLLALPVRDTMKRQTAEGRVDATVDRSGLWHAMTPQMFKLPLLIKALNNALEKKLHVTDDASAMELAGYHPLLVACHEDNIKITRPFDLTLATLYMQQQTMQQKTASKS
jgi:2-C-methyl-D-erythritol 4-phosphate cytidylyltransferase